MCRTVLFDKLDKGNMHGLDTSNVSSRAVSRRDVPSGIWAIGNRSSVDNFDDTIFFSFIMVICTFDRHRGSAYAVFSALL